MKPKNFPVVTALFVIINIVFFLLFRGNPNIFALSRDALTARSVLLHYLMHGSPASLVIYTCFLAVFGTLFEHLVSRRQMLFFYLAGSVLSGVFYLAASSGTVRGAEVSLLGCGGGLGALIGACGIICKKVSFKIKSFVVPVMALIGFCFCVLILMALSGIASPCVPDNYQSAWAMVGGYLFGVSYGYRAMKNGEQILARKTKPKGKKTSKKKR